MQRAPSNGEYRIHFVPTPKEGGTMKLQLLINYFNTLSAPATCTQGVIGECADFVSEERKNRVKYSTEWLSKKNGVFLFLRRMLIGGAIVSHLVVPDMGYSIFVVTDTVKTVTSFFLCCSSSPLRINYYAVRSSWFTYVGIGLTTWWWWLCDYGQPAVATKWSLVVVQQSSWFINERSRDKIGSRAWDCSSFQNVTLSSFYRECSDLFLGDHQEGFVKSHWDSDNSFKFEHNLHFFCLGEIKYNQRDFSH